MHTETALFAVNRQKAHALMASVCLTLLLDPQMPAWTPDADENDIRVQTEGLSPLVAYAGVYWPRHYRESQEDRNVRRLVMQLLQAENRALPTSIMLTEEARECAQMTSTSRWGRYYFDYLKVTPLYYASALGFASIVAELCASYPSDGDPGTGRIDEDSGNGHTALWVAVLNGNEEVVRVLLRNGADADTRAEEMPVLHLAFHVSPKSIFQILLENGANVNAWSIYGTVLHLASMGGSEAAVRLLLAAKADVNAPGPWGTALEQATVHGDEAAVRLLLAAGADVNAPGPWGTALQFASGRGHEAVAQLLLAAGADVNASGPRGGKEGGSGPGHLMTATAGTSKRLYDKGATWDPDDNSDWEARTDTHTHH